MTFRNKEWYEKAVAAQTDVVAQQQARINASIECGEFSAASIRCDDLKSALNKLNDLTNKLADMS